MSLPSTSRAPGVGRPRSRKSRARVVFPDPDSPTMPSVSPSPTCTLTPSRALIHPRARRPEAAGQREVSLQADPCSTCQPRAPAAAPPSSCARGPLHRHRGGYVSSQTGCALGTPRRERAPRPEPREVRGLAPDLDELLARLWPDIRQTAQERLGIGMPRVVEDLERGPHLHDLPRVHDGHAVGVGGHDAEVVSDQDDRDAGGGLHLLEQVQVLGLNGHVERGRRLVGDEQLGRARERDGARHALAHPPAELVRVLPEARVGGRDAQAPQRPEHPLAQRRAAQALVEPHHLPHLDADGERGVQRRHRVLEHHGDLLAAHPAHLGRALVEEVLSLEQDATADDAPRRLGHEPYQRQAGDRLARARLSHEGERLPGVEGEAHPVDRPGDPAPCEEMSLEVLHHEQRSAGHHLPLSFTSS